MQTSCMPTGSHQVEYNPTFIFAYEKLRPKGQLVQQLTVCDSLPVGTQFVMFYKAQLKKPAYQVPLATLDLQSGTQQTCGCARQSHTVYKRFLSGDSDGHQQQRCCGPILRDCVELCCRRLWTRLQRALSSWQPAGSPHRTSAAFHSP